MTFASARQYALHGLRFSIPFLLCAVLAAPHAFAVHLKRESFVESGVVTLGDVFEGLSSDSGYVLSAAPAYGQDLVINARTLTRVAEAFDLPWRPSSLADQVVVRRAFQLVPVSDVHALIQKKLEESVIGDRFDIEFLTPIPEIALPQAHPATAEIRHMRYDPATQRFDAEIAAPSVAHPIITRTLSGRVRPLVRVPVLREPLRSGDIIDFQHLDFMDIPVRDIADNIILDESHITGMTPRRMIPAGRPVRDMDVELPKVVSRGDPVTIIFQSGTLSLTAKGRALQSGAKGDMVRVSNAGSSRNVDGIVTGHGEITVR